jgi:YbbR domain-containing protein
VVVEANKKEVSLPVKAQVQGDLPVGYNISMEPAEVKAFGSQEVLSQLTEALTESLVIEGKTESFVQEVKLVKVEGIVFLPCQIKKLTYIVIKYIIFIQDRGVYETACVYIN